MRNHTSPHEPQAQDGMDSGGKQKKEKRWGSGGKEGKWLEPMPTRWIGIECDRHGRDTNNKNGLGPSWAFGPMRKHSRYESESLHTHARAHARSHTRASKRTHACTTHAHKQAQARMHLRRHAHTHATHTRHTHTHTTHACTPSPQG